LLLARKMLFIAPFLLLNIAFVDGASVIQECIRSNGTEYRGEKQTTASGYQCLNWTLVTRDYNITAHPDTETGVGNHSYCRNPDGSALPWCYVTSNSSEVKRQLCAFEICKDQATPAAVTEGFRASSSSEQRIFESAESLSSQSEGAAVQPVIGISQRSGPKQKKDLGTLGYVMGILMMAVIIILGVGITLGYLYKRGRDLKKQHDQRVYEREMQRITLPLSAFSNPTCEIVDENTIVISTHQTPVEDVVEGSDPLMGQAGTPGA
uniref:Phosphoinositide-3-kinase interacting protein 1 n=2 Tax=Lepisosteus oculatus TaxID=7918 RepID=W5MBQ9_LEPOC